MKDSFKTNKYTSCYQIWWISDEKWPIKTFYNPLKLKLSSVHWSCSESMVFLCVDFVKTFTVVCIRESQWPFYVIKSLTLASILEEKYTMTLYSLEFHFAIDGSFKMRYSIIYYLLWHRNYKRSKLKLSDLLSRKNAFIFDVL